MTEPERPEYLRPAQSPPAPTGNQPPAPWYETPTHPLPNQAPPPPRVQQTPPPPRVHQPPTSPQTQPAPPPPQAPHGAQSPEDEAGVGSLVVGLGVDLVFWLAPLVFFGGLGLFLVSSGTETIDYAFGSETIFHRRAIFGFAFLAVAVAIFFGRGTFASLGRVIKGEGGFFQSITVGSSLYAALIALGASAAAVWLFFEAFTA